MASTRVYKTACMLLGCVTAGMSGGIVGPTFVHMVYVLNTTTQGLSLTFIAESIGGVIGAVLCAFFFDNYNNEYQFSVGYLCLGICISVSPWMPNTLFYSMILMAKGIATSYLLAAEKSYLLNLWSGHRLKDSVCQAGCLAWSIGAVTVPLLVIPFLSDIPQDSSGVVPADVFRVRYAFLIPAITAVIVSILFYIIFKQDCNYNRNNFKDKLMTKNEQLTLLMTDPDDNVHTDQQKAQLQKILKMLIFLFIAMLVCQEAGLGAFLSTFVIRGLGWSVEKGPLITSLFRATHGFGRFIGVIISLVLTPTTILMFNMCLSVTSLVLMLSAVTSLQSEVLMWLSTALAGLAMSNTFSTTVLWGAEYFTVTASYGSIFNLGASVGYMFCTGIGGHLLQHYSHVTLIYFFLFVSVTTVFVFIIMLRIGRKCKNIVQ